MSMTNTQALLTIFLIAAATLATRVIPFLLFPGDRTPPSYIVYLGKVLPSATMGMLVVYCIKNVSPASWPHGLPECIAMALVGFAQYKWRNSLLSIALGSAAYMILIRLF